MITSRLYFFNPLMLESSDKLYICRLDLYTFDNNFENDSDFTK